MRIVYKTGTSSPFFEAWEVPTSAGARATVENLPAWMPSGIKPGLKK